MQCLFFQAIPLLAQASSAPAVVHQDLNQLMEEIVQFPHKIGGPILLWMLLSQVVAILAFWISSNVVNRETAGFGNAVKTWLGYVIGEIAVLFVGGVAVVVGSARHSPNIQLAGCVLAGILSLFVIFSIPITIYRIGFFSTIGFLIMAMIVSVAAQIGLTRLFDSAVVSKFEVIEKIAKLSPADRKELEKRFEQRFKSGGAVPMDPASIAADRNRSIEERHTALETYYRELEAKRTSISPTDQAAVESYTAEVQRYQQLVNQLQADAAAAPKTTPETQPATP